MGKNQDANWGITTDWVDKVAGTKSSHPLKYDDRKASDPMINLK